MYFIFSHQTKHITQKIFFLNSKISKKFLIIIGSHDHAHGYFHTSERCFFKGSNTTDNIPYLLLIQFKATRTIQFYVILIIQQEFSFWF